MKPFNRIIFPSPEQANPEGIVCWSGQMDWQWVLSAYVEGIFPWPCDEKHILWFSPDPRAVLDLDELILHKRSLRTFRRKKFEFRMNTAFEQVIRHCACVPRKGQEGTWITEPVIRAYLEAYRAGFAWSFETFDPSGKLVGGMYGIRLGNFVSGESLFHLESEASRFALAHAAAYWKGQGITWMDIQVLNDFTAGLGGKNISRQEFLTRLKDALPENLTEITETFCRRLSGEEMSIPEEEKTGKRG